MELRSPALLDPERVRSGFEDWIGSRSPGLRPRVVEIQRPAGSGGSAENLLITLLRETDGEESLEKVALRLAPGAFRVIYESDLATQCAVLAALVPTHLSTPEPLWLEEDPGVLGAPFLVTTQLPGLAPSDFPTYHEAGFVADASIPQRRAIWGSAIESLVAVAGVDPSLVAFLDRPDRGDSPLLQLLTYLGEAASWAYDGSVPDRVSALLGWLNSAAPYAAPSGLSWGDARMGNLLFEGSRCTGVLDWESASLAGPLVDLGWWLLFDRLHAHDFEIPRLEGLGDRVETIATWELGTGLKATDVDWYEILAAVGLLLRRQRAADLRSRLLGVGIDPADPRSVPRLLTSIERLVEVCA